MVVIRRVSSKKWRSHNENFSAGIYYFLCSFVEGIEGKDMSLQDFVSDLFPSALGLVTACSSLLASCPHTDANDDTIGSVSQNTSFCFSKPMQVHDFGLWCPVFLLLSIPCEGHYITYICTWESFSVLSREALAVWHVRFWSCSWDCELAGENVLGCLEMERTMYWIPVNSSQSALRKECWKDVCLMLGSDSMDLEGAKIRVCSTSVLTI